VPSRGRPARADKPPGAYDCEVVALVDWLFRDRRTGRLVIAQFPNAALWIFLITVVLRWVVSGDTSARTVIDGIGDGALGWWAIDGVLRGVNPWRRLLGGAGVVFAVSGAVSLLR